jgi:hypothetical protein
MEEATMCRAEIKKLFSFQVLWILLACMLCLNGYVKLSNAYSRYYSPSEYKSCFSEIRNMTTEEVLEYCEDKLENSSETINTYLYYDISEICRELLDYPDYLNKITQNSENMTAVSIWGGEDTFSYRNIQKTPSAYKNLNPEVLPIDTSLGVEDFLNSPVTDFLALLLLFICICRIFLHDREQGILPLIYATPNGRSRLILTKTACAILCSAFLVLIFFVELFLIENNLYGFGDFSRPIQSVFGYYTCNLAVSVGEYMGLYILIKVLAYSVFAVIFSFICTISKNNLAVYGISAGICGVFYLLYSKISVLSSLSLLHYWNPVQLLYAKEILGTYTNVNLIGYPVSLKFSSVLLAFVLMIVIIFFTCIVFSKTRNLQYKNISFINKFHFKPRIHSVFYYTCKRYLILQKGIVVLLLTLIVSLGFSQTVKRFYDNDEIYYENFCTEYAGEINENTKQFIAEKLQFYKETEEEIAVLESTDNPSYFKLNTLYANLNDKNAFEKFKSRIDSIPENATIFYDTGYKRYFGADNNKDNIILLLFIMISLVLILSPIPSQDNKTQMTKILYATRSGKASYFRNILCFSAILSTIISLIVSIPYLYQIQSKYGIAGISDSINGIAEFSSFPTFMSVGFAMLLMILLRILFSIFCAVLITMISSKCKGVTSAYCINSVVFILPVLILLSGLIG